MTIIRAPRPESQYLTIRNDVVRDERLSYRAAGLLAAVLSLPDGAGTSAEALVRPGHEGRDAVKTALRELRAAGYVVQEKTRTEGGQIITTTTVYDTPQASPPATENPSPVPTRGNDASPLVGPETDSPAPVNPAPKEEQPSQEENLSPGDSVPEDETEQTEGPSPEVFALCGRLAAAIEANGSKPPTVGKRWWDAARLMMERDGRTPRQIANMIDWCQADPFWRSNILSMPTLREKYDQMRLKALSTTPTGSQTTGEAARVQRSFTPPPPPDDMPGRLFTAWNKAHVAAWRENRPGPSTWQEVA